MVEVERRLQHRRRDRRQEKRTPIFIENILRGFDCVTKRLKEFVEKENKKRESKEKDSEKKKRVKKKSSTLLKSPMKKIRWVG